MFGRSGTRSRTVPSRTPSLRSPELQLDWCITVISCFGTPHQRAGSCRQRGGKEARGAPHYLGMVSSLLLGSCLDPAMPRGSGSRLGPSLLILECNAAQGPEAKG